MQAISERAAVLAAILSLVSIEAVGAQDRQRAAVYISTAEIEATLDAQGETGGGGASVQISDPGAFAPEVMVRRRFASEPNNASVHPDRDEIYLVLDGGGMLMTGGTFVDPEDRPAGIRGGEERQIGPGDFVMIPAGVAHWFSRIGRNLRFVILLGA